jgi:glucosamine--fructose-6-phosphate aminotransferase (isomerizing)
MCGIVGYIGHRRASPVLLEGLQSLEYRGYDSAGIALIHNGYFDLIRSSGKLTNLAKKIDPKHSSKVGIGHTRWATHGRPSEENAHPHVSQNAKIVTVHNGIFENFIALRSQLGSEGFHFKSETDTECFPLLVERSMNEGLLFQEAFSEALKSIEGIYALACMHADHPQMILVARSGPPLALGIGQGEMFIASDAIPLLKYTQQIIFLEDGDWAEISQDHIRIYSSDNKEIVRPIHNIAYDPQSVEKIGFNHYMQKEIFEQPQAISNTLYGRLPLGDEPIPLALSLSDDILKKVERVLIVACGTSWHAGLIGKFYLEAFSKIPVEVDYASEFRYRDAVVGHHTLAIMITQSGETADTLAALKELKRLGAITLAICNMQGSSVTRLADATLLTLAGPEIGVASTKAFTTQLIALMLLTLKLSDLKQTLSNSMRIDLIQGLRELPAHIEQTLLLEPQIKKWAADWYGSRDFLYLGRGPMYPIALEGALKLKEISYIHAEGYPAGEMKHGPIALIDSKLPIVALLPRDAHHDKMVSNLQEAAARDGQILGLVTKGDKSIETIAKYILELPEVQPYLAPVIFMIPLQLLAYHIALWRNCDVDQPRNLAKSVTVE